MNVFYMHTIGSSALVIGGFVCGVLFEKKVLPLIAKVKEAWAVLVK